MTILETFIKLRDDLKTWVTNNLNQKANISYVDEKFDSIPEFDQIEIDATLTKEGFAADAKAVGDSLSETKSYILNIDYDAILAFDTSEVIFGTNTTSSVLGQAILGQMILA